MGLHPTKLFPKVSYIIVIAIEPSCVVVNEGRSESECSRFLLRVARDHWPVCDHKCPQCPASHPH